MARKFIATVLTAAIVIAGFNAAPARADGRELAQAIAGIAAVAIIANALNDKRKKDEPQLGSRMAGVTLPRARCLTAWRARRYPPSACKRSKTGAAAPWMSWANVASRTTFAARGICRNPVPSTSSRTVAGAAGMTQDVCRARVIPSPAAEPVQSAGTVAASGSSGCRGRGESHRESDRPGCSCSLG